MESKYIFVVLRNLLALETHLQQRLTDDDVEALSNHILEYKCSSRFELEENLAEFIKDPNADYYLFYAAENRSLIDGLLGYTSFDAGTDNIGVFCAAGSPGFGTIMYNYVVKDRKIQQSVIHAAPGAFVFWFSRGFLPFETRNNQAMNLRNLIKLRQIVERYKDRREYLPELLEIVARSEKERKARLNLSTNDDERWVLQNMGKYLSGPFYDMVLGVNAGQRVEIDYTPKYSCTICERVNVDLFEEVGSEVPRIFCGKNCQIKCYI